VDQHESRSVRSSPHPHGDGSGVLGGAVVRAVVHAVVDALEPFDSAGDG
jgi:hypothetical protein